MSGFCTTICCTARVCRAQARCVPAAWRPGLVRGSDSRAAHREGPAELAEPPLDTAPEALLLLRLLRCRPLATDHKLPLVLPRLHLHASPGESVRQLK